MENSLAKVQKDANSFLVIGNKLVSRSEELNLVVFEDVQVARAIKDECLKAEKELEEKRVEILKPIRGFVEEVNTLFKETANPILTAKNTVNQKIAAYQAEQERIKREEEAKKLSEERERLRKLEEERLERERIEAAKREEEQKALRAEQERLRKIEEAQLAKELEARKASEAEQAKIRAEQEKQRLEREKLEQERLELERQKREVEEEKRRQEEQRKLDEAKRLQEEVDAKKAQEMKIKGISKRWAYEITDENLVPRAYCTSDSKKINEAIKKGVRQIEGVRIFESTIVR